MFEFYMIIPIEQAFRCVVETYRWQMNKWMGQEVLSREFDLRRIIVIFNNGTHRFPFTYGISLAITIKNISSTCNLLFVICLFRQPLKDAIQERHTSIRNISMF